LLNLTLNLTVYAGLDGCFIKLSTGQQILAATGRDGNNNIFPIAFGVVDKEDGHSWSWFLNQLRVCIGTSNKFGNYTIMSDRQKVCTYLKDIYSSCFNLFLLAAYEKNRGFLRQLMRYFLSPHKGIALGISMPTFKLLVLEGKNLKNM
jgi:hypothetical protein